MATKQQRGSQGLLTFARPQTGWRPPVLSDLPSSWKGIRRIAYDIECRDDHLKALGIGCRRGGYIVGYSFAIEDGPAHYVPMRHDLGGNVEDASAAWRYLTDRLWEFDGTLVTHGGAFDIDYTTTAGAKFHPNVKHRDTALCEALINEWAGKYDLDSVLARYDLDPKDETVLNEAAAAYGFHKKKDLWRFPADLVGAYGTRDVTALHPLLRKQETRIEDEDLWGAVETESQLLPVVVRMRQRGVKVHQDRLAQFGRWATKRRDHYIELFRQAAGLRTFSIEEMRSAVKFNAVVKAVTGKDLPKTDADNYKTDEETLKEIKHPAFVHILAAKGVDTVIKNFYNGTVEHMTNGRIHTTFKQLIGEREGSNPNAKDATNGAAFGRMASSHPNLQNQPNPERDPEVGGRWRSIYVPDEDELLDYVVSKRLRKPNWVCADFSQQEPRHGIHWAEWKGYPGARAAGDMLRANPAMDPYEPMVRETGLPRGIVKVLYLALTYNMSERRLCDSLGLPTERYFKHGKWRVRAGEEGRRIIDRMNERAPYIGLLRDECSRLARERGYIVLLDKRRCRFMRDDHGNVLDDGVALNRLLQGGAGVQTKKVLIAADRLGMPLQLVVHDDLSLSGYQWADQLVEVMQDTVKLSVPMRAKRKIGHDYAEASGYGIRDLFDAAGAKIGKEEFRPTEGAPDDQYMEAWEWVKQEST